MRYPEQVRWDFVQQWLSKAEHDLNTVDVLLKSDIENFESAGFHAQQAVEKFIKAMLVLTLSSPMQKKSDISGTRFAQRVAGFFFSDR